MRIFGVDPGSNRIGYGCIDVSRETLSAVEYGTIEIVSGTNRHQGIIELASRFRELLRRLTPEYVGIETLYFSKNKKTAMSVSESRGILLLLSLEQHLPVLECEPKTVKLAVTRYGLADKRAVMKMVSKILNLREFEAYDDASDALAIAIATAQNISAAKLLKES